MGDPGERQARGDALGEDEDVGLDPDMLDGEEPPGAPEAGLDLIGREKDAVLAKASTGK